MGLFGIGNNAEPPRVLKAGEVTAIAANEIIEVNRGLQGHLSDINLNSLNERSSIVIELAQTQTNYIDHVLKGDKAQKVRVRTAINNLTKLIPELQKVIPRKHEEISGAIAAMKDMHHQLK